MQALPSFLQSLYDEREESFLNSLQNILSTMSTDKYIRQMFDDKLSANYVPDRICEIIKYFLNEEREVYVEEIMKKLKAIEAIFGSEVIQQVEDVGNRMMQVSMTQAQKEAEYRKCLRVLNEKIGGFQSQIGGTIRGLKNKVDRVVDDADEAKKSVKYFTSSVKADLQRLKNRAKRVVDRYESNIEKLKNENNKLKRQINQLQESLNETDDRVSQLKGSLKEKYNEKLQNKIKDYQESELHDMLEEKERQLSKSKEKIQEMMASSNKERKEAMAKQNELQNSIRKLNSKNEQKDDQIQELKDQLANLKSGNEKLDSIQKKLFDSQQKNQDLKNKSQKLQSAVQKLQNEVDQKDEEIAEKQKAIRSFENDINEQTNLNTKLQKSLLQLKEQMRNKDNEISKLKDKLDDQMEQTNKQLSSLESLQNMVSQIPQLTNDKSDAERKIRDLEKQNQDLKNKLGDLQEVTQKARQQLNQIKAMAQAAPTKEDLLKQVQDLMRENSGLRMENNALQGQNQSMQHELQTVKRNLESANAQYKEKSKKLDKIKSQLSNSHDLMHNSQMKIEDLAGRCSEYESSLKLLAKKYQQKEKLLDSHKKSQNDLRKKLQESEENNQMLSSSLSNANLQLGSLKNEIRKRDDTIEQLKDAASYGSMAENELMTTKRALNEKISMLNNSEDRNAALLREVEKKERTIKDLSNQIFDRDNEIKRLKQNQITQEKQNETLKSLSTEQQRQIDEAHQNLMKMRDDMIRLQNEVQSNADSVKSMSFDHKRESEGRKQIQNINDDDRSKYRNKVNMLEEENSRLKVEKTNLEHQLDQMKFDNQSLAQQLSAKDTEFMHHKDSFEQDLLSTRGATNKLIEENKQLKQRLMDRELYENEIIKQAQDNLRTSRPNARFPLTDMDDFPELAKKYSSLNDDLASIGESLNALNPKDIKTEIAKLQEQNKELNQNERELYSLFPEVNSNTKTGKKLILDSISDLKNGSNDLKELKKRLQDLTKSDNPLKTVQTSLEQLRDFKMRENELSRVVPDYEFEKVPSIFAQLQRENQTNNKILGDISRAIGGSKSGSYKSNNYNSLPGVIEDSMNRLKGYEMSEHAIQDIMPISSLNELPQAIKKIIQSNDSMSNDMRKINNMIPREFDEEDLPEKIEALVKQHNEDQRVIQNIKDVIPDSYKRTSSSYSNNYLPEAIARIVNDNDEEKKKKDSQLNKLLKKNNDLLNERGEIAHHLQCSEDDNIIQKVAEIVDSKKKTLKNLEELANSFSNNNSSSKRNEDEIFKLLKDSMKKMKDSHKSLKTIGNIVKADRYEEIPEKVKELIQQKDKAIDKLDQINSFFPNSKNEDVVNKVKNEISDGMKVKQELDNLRKMIPENLLNQNLGSSIQNLFHDNEQKDKILKKLSNIITNAVDSINAGKNNSRRYNRFSKNDDEIGDIVEKAESLAKNNEEMTELYNKLKSMLQLSNEIFTPNDIISAIENLTSENNIMGNQLEEINSIIPNNSRNQDIASKIEEMHQRQNDLDNIIEGIIKIIPNCKDKDDILPRIGNIVESITAIDEIVKPSKRKRSDSYDFQPPIEERIVKNVAELKNSADDLSDKILKILEIVQNADEDNLLQSLKKEINDKEKLIQTLNDIAASIANGSQSKPKKNKQQINNADDFSEIASIVKDEIKEKNQLDEIISEIDQILPENEEKRSKNDKNNRNKNILSRVQKEMEDKSKLMKQLKEIESSFPKLKNGNPIDTIKNELAEKERIKKLIDDINNAIPGNKKDDILKRIIDNQQQKEQFKQTLDDINNALPGNKKDDILKRIIDDQQQKEQFKQTLDDINDIIPGNKRDNIVQRTKNNQHEKEQLAEIIKEAESVLPKSKESNLAQRISKEMDEKEHLLEHLKEIESLFPNRRNDKTPIIDQIKNSVDEIGKLNNIIQAIDKIVPKGKNNKDLIDRVQNVISDKEKSDKIMNEINSILPKGSGSKNKDIVDRIKNELETKEHSQGILKEIDSILPNSKNKSASLLDRIKDELNEKEKLKEILESLESEIPGNSREDPINRLRKILEEKEELENQMKDIKSKIPKGKNRDENISNRIQKEIERKEELEELFNEISSLFPNLKGNKQDLAEKIQQELEEKENILEQLKEIDSSLPGKDNVFNKIRKCNAENEIFKEELEEIEAILPKSKEGKISKRVQAELDKKDDLTRQMNEISNHFDNNNSFDNISNLIHDLQEENDIMKKGINEISNIIQTPNKSKIKFNQSKSNNITEDDINELIGKLQEKIDLLNEIDSLFKKSNNNKNLVKKIDDILKQKEYQEDLLNQIQKQLPNAKAINDILPSLNAVLKENEESNDLINAVSSIILKDKNNDILQAAQDIVNQNEILKQFLDEIDNILPNDKPNRSRKDSSKSLGDRISNDIDKIKELVKMADSLNKQIKNVKSILPNTGNKDDLLENIKKEVDQKDKAIQKLKNIKELIPNATDDDLEKRVESLIELNGLQKDLIDKLDNVLPENEQEKTKKTKRKNQKFGSEPLEVNFNLIERAQDLIQNKEEIAKEASEMREILDELNSDLGTNDGNVVSKVNELLEEKESQQQTLNNILSLLPKSSKKNENLIQALQNELKEKDDLQKEFSNIASSLPNFKEGKKSLSDHVKIVLQDNNLLRKALENISNSLNSMKDKKYEVEDNNADSLTKVVPQNVKTLSADYDSLQMQMKEIIALTPSSKKGKNQNITDSLKNEFENNQNNQKLLNNILSLMTSAKKPEDIFNELQDLIHDHDSLKEEHERLADILDLDNDEQLIPKTESLKKNNDDMNLLIKEIDELLQQDTNNPKQRQKSKQPHLIDRLKNELKDKENLANQANKIEKIINKIKPNSDQNLIESLQDIVSQIQDLETTIKKVSNTLPDTDQNGNSFYSDIDDDDFDSINKGVINQAQYAASEIDRLNKLVHDINSLLPQNKMQSKKGQNPQDNILQRLKNELDNKDKTNTHLESIKKLLPNSQSIEDLPSQLSQTISNNNLLKSLLKKAIDIIHDYYNNENVNSDDENIEDDFATNGNGDKFLDALHSIVDALDNKTKELYEIEQLFPATQDKNLRNRKAKPESLKDRILKDKAGNDKNSENLSKLYDLFDDNDLDNILSTIRKQNDDVKRAIDVLNNEIEKDNLQNNNKVENEDKNIAELANKVIQMKHDSENTLKELDQLIKSPSQKYDKPIVDRAKELIEENNKLKIQIRQVMELLPNVKSFDEIINNLTSILNQKNKLDDQMNHLRSMFPDSKLHESIYKKIPNDIDDLSNQLKSILKEKEEVAKILNADDNNIKKTCEDLVNENNKLRKLIKEIKQITNTESDEEVPNCVKSMKETINSSSDLFIRLLEILAGPLAAPAALKLPVPQQVQEKLWSILTSLKQKLTETDEKIVQILTKAKKAGFNGSDAFDAVTYLEDIASIYEQQRINEEYHQQVSDLRQIMDKQHKTYEMTRNKYLAQTKENKETIADLQEKFSLREAELLKENEDSQKQIASLREDLDKANRIKSELLRFSCGQPVDINYLKSNISRTENSLLSNAEKIRTLVLQMQNSKQPINANPTKIVSQTSKKGQTP